MVTTIRASMLVAVGGALAGSLVLGVPAVANAADATTTATTTAAAAPTTAQNDRSWIAGRYDSERSCRRAGERGEYNGRWRGYDCDYRGRGGDHRDRRDHRDHRDRRDHRDHRDHRNGHDRLDDHGDWVLRVWR